MRLATIDIDYQPSDSASPPAPVRMMPIGFGSTAVQGHCSANISVQVPFDAVIERISIPAEICAVFLVTDFKVGRNSQLSTPGALPAGVFSADDARPFSPEFETIKKGEFIAISVTNQRGETFNFQGVCIVRRIEPAMATDTISSAKKGKISMTPFWKTYTFWAAVGLWLATLGGHYADVIPSPYGLVVANAVAIIYAVVRCMQKRAWGISWKGIFFTSEFIVSALTVIVNFLESLSQIPALSPGVLAGISTTTVLLVSLLHSLSGKSKTHLGIPVVPADELDTVVERGKAKKISPS